MSNIEMQNEQWKLNGDCSKCRRRDYCTKPCTKCKTRNSRIMTSFVVSKMLEVMTSKER